MRLIAAGKTMKEIGRKRFLSVRTVSTWFPPIKTAISICSDAARRLTSPGMDLFDHDVATPPFPVDKTEPVIHCIGRTLRHW